MKDVPFEETAIELLRKKPGVAAELLNIALKEDTPAELGIVLRQILAAGYHVSLIPAPEQAKRTRMVAPMTAKRSPASRPRSRRSAVVAIA